MTTIVDQLSELMFQINLWAIVAAVVVVILTRWIAGLGRRWLARLLERVELPPSLETLLVNLLYYGILFSGLLVALSFLGLPVESILAVVGVLIIILGIAVRESLANLAATIIFLVYAPFKAGDTIETLGYIGDVVEIQMFSTHLKLGDNRHVFLPNGQIQENGIVNYSRASTLRLDIPLNIYYQQDIEQARQAVLAALQADDRVLPDPLPAVSVGELGDTNIRLNVRAYVYQRDYFACRPDLLEAIKSRLASAGVALPSPQLGVTLTRQPGTAAGERE